MANDIPANGKNTPLTTIANKLYPGNQNTNGADGPQNNQDANTSARANDTHPDANPNDPLALFFDWMEKHPDTAYTQSFDKRHPELEHVTPEFRPFLREVMMREEFKGWRPSGVKTIRPEKEELEDIANGTSSLSDPKHSKHIDLGRGSDAADVVDTRYGWGPRQQKGKKLTPAQLIQKQRSQEFFQAQKNAFDLTKQRMGQTGDRYTYGGDWKNFPDVAHIENSDRVLPEPQEDDDAN